MNKSLLILLIAAGSTFGIFTTPVQGQNMQTVNALLSQNHMNQQMQMQMQMNLMRLNMAKGSTVLYNPKASYKVMLKDSTLKDVKSKILFDERNISYLEAENKSFKKGDPNRIQRIYPADTRFVHRVELSGQLSPVGLPADSCWLFKVVRGKVNAYSFLPSAPVPHSGYLKFVQKADGQLQKPEMEVVKNLVGNDHKAVMKAYEQDFYGALLEYNKVKRVKN